MKILYNDTLDAFECMGIIKHGHFKLTSGEHADTYINKDLIHWYPKLYNKINYDFYSLTGDLDDIDVITGPPLAGAFFAKTVAVEANKPFIYPEKVNKEIVLKRGFDRFIKNKRILVIEDIITTGGSVEKLIKILENLKAIIVKVLCICNRKNWNKYKCESIIDLKLNSYKADQCPLCKQGIPLTDPKI